MIEAPAWFSYVGVFVFVALVVWIPVAVYRASNIWDRKWKRIAWTAAHFPVLNLLVFPVYLLTIVCKRTAKWDSGLLRWTWRALAVVPGINPPVVLGFFRLARVQDAADAAELNRLRGVVAFYSAIVVTGLLLAVFGRPPAVALTAEQVENPGFERHLAAERKFLTGDANVRPNVCVALSGGGIRSAAFSLGVLQTLHETGILGKVDIVSAVSGGTYALSWLVLQPYYSSAAAGGPVEAASVDATLSSMFQDNGPFQENLRNRSYFVESQVAGGTAAIDATLGQLFRPLILLMSGSDVTLANGTETRRNYAAQIQLTFHDRPRRVGDAPESTNRLVLAPELQTVPGSLWAVQDVEFSKQGRAELDPRSSAVTGITAATDGLREFFDRTRPSSEGRIPIPYPIFNMSLAVNAGPSGTLWPGHFETTPLGIGGPAVGYADWSSMTHDGHRSIRSVNIAPAVSGAALSGYAQVLSPWQRLALRLLNADLGHYVPSPFSTTPPVIYVSDGGHSENLGLYALIRRECQQIIAVDAEYEPNATDRDEPKYKFEAYEKLIKALKNEDIATVTLQKDFDISTLPEPFFSGDLAYTSGRRASLLYIKLALDRAQLAGLPAEVTQYATPEHPRFPHDPTTDQSYAPEQFHAYQKLGYYTACRATAASALRITPCSR